MAMCRVFFPSTVLLLLGFCKCTANSAKLAGCSCYRHLHDVYTFIYFFIYFQFAHSCFYYISRLKNKTDDKGVCKAVLPKSGAYYWNFNTMPRASFLLTQLFIVSNCSLNIDTV